MPTADAKAQRPRKRAVVAALGFTTSGLEEGIRDYAKSKRWALSLLRRGQMDEQQMDASISHAQPDGVLLAEGFANVRHCPRGAARACLVCGEEPADLPFVALDNAAIGRLAGEHLVERGFRHFAFGALFPHDSGAPRARGFQEATEKIAETFFYVGLRGNDPESDEHLKRFRREIHHLPKPLGLMTLNDHVGDLLARACQREGILVPEQVAIVGVDNSISAELATVPLTSVDPDYYRLGFEAAALLDRLMDGEPAPEQPIRIPPKTLVQRDSSNIHAVEHVGVARALRFILNRYTEPTNGLRLDQVAAVAGLSTRQLQTVFADAMGCPVGEYIRGLRLEHAKRLLRETDQPIGDVAEASGYHSTGQLNTHLRGETGLGPRAWRKQNQCKN